MEDYFGSITAVFFSEWLREGKRLARQRRGAGKQASLFRQTEGDKVDAKLRRRCRSCACYGQRLTVDAAKGLVSVSISGTVPADNPQDSRDSLIMTIAEDGSVVWAPWVTPCDLPQEWIYAAKKAIEHQRFFGDACDDDGELTRLLYTLDECDYLPIRMCLFRGTIHRLCSLGLEHTIAMQNTSMSNTKKGVSK